MPKPDISFRLWVDPCYKYGFVVRTFRMISGVEVTTALSRKTGRWIQVTAGQIRRHDVPVDCKFPVDELMPVADQS